MKTLTEDQIKKYIEKNGKNCPFCESDFIEGAGVEFLGDDTLYGIVKCNECGEWWRDECEIKLVNVLYTEEDEYNKEHYYDRYDGMEPF